MKPGPRPRSAGKRFWATVDKSDRNGCWKWGGFIGHDGYGRFNHKGRSILAHRFAWEILIGDIPDGIELDHKCHCRSCVNPEHMRPATRAENSRNSYMRKDNKCGMKGVRFRNGRWVSEIQVDKKRFQLGHFDTKELAHAAYCVAARRLHGEFANFGGERCE